MKTLLIKYEEDLQGEIWKDIEEFKGIYQISNMGRVKSLERKGRPNTCLLSLDSRNQGDYVLVKLRKDGRTYTRYPHRLVAKEFLGHVPSGYDGLCVNHINHIRNDNRLSNLELISFRENTSDRKSNRTTSNYIGVSYYKITGKWISHIMYKKKNYHLGYFFIEEDARDVYQEALKEINNGTFLKWYDKK